MGRRSMATRRFALVLAGLVIAGAGCGFIQALTTRPTSTTPLQIPIPISSSIQLGLNGRCFEALPLKGTNERDEERQPASLRG